MVHDRENNRNVFFGLRTKYDTINRFGLLLGNKPAAIVLPEDLLLSFDEGDRFQDFRLSPERRAYLNQLQRKQRNSGVASKRVLFCDATSGDAAPLWKMATLTWIGLCFTVGVLRFLIGPWISNWHWFTNLLFFNAVVVLLLTWLVMPVLTRIAQVWLQS